MFVVVMVGSNLSQRFDIVKASFWGLFKTNENDIFYGDVQLLGFVLSKFGQVKSIRFVIVKIFSHILVLFIRSCELASF